MNRILPEKTFKLKNSRFEVLTSNRGAILKSVKVDGVPICLEINGETEPGKKGALFCAPVVFGRLKDRLLQFEKQEYSMPFPEDLEDDKIDPKRIYIHGIHHYYTWDALEESEFSITYKLSSDRLPKNYPFPHCSFVRYSMHDEDFFIEVGIENPIRKMPAMLTIHPFFKFYLSDSKIPPMLKVNLNKKFNYDANSEFPLNWDSPKNFEDKNHFKNFSSLPKDLDHSFLASPTSEIKWPNGIHLVMTDETDTKICYDHPLQIWTTGADERNAFGIEQGGPANLFWLVENGKVERNLLPTVSPSETISRKVRYSAK